MPGLIAKWFNRLIGIVIRSGRFRYKSRTKVHRQDECLLPRYFVADRNHLSEAGYAIWVETIRKSLELNPGHRAD